MRAYRIGDSGDIVELGPADASRLDEWLASEEAQAPHADRAAFGLYRDERDFIELGAVGGGKFLLHSDRLARPEGWLRGLFAKPHLGRELASRNEAIACAQDYIALSRTAFEAKYG
jgi:hypothetical protein